MGRQPHITHVRAFGCLAYPFLNLNVPETKMSGRATRGIYLGRAPEQSAYVVYDLSSNRVSVTPHVRFVETEFPGVGPLRDEPRRLGPEDIFTSDATTPPHTLGPDWAASQPQLEEEREPPLRSDRLPDILPAPWRHPPAPETEPQRHSPDNLPAASDIEIEVDAIVDREPPSLIPVTPNDAADADEPVAEQWDSSRLTRAGRGVHTSRYEPTMHVTGALAAPGGPFILYLCSGPRQAGDFASQVTAANAGVRTILHSS